MDNFWNCRILPPGSVKNYFTESFFINGKEAKARIGTDKSKNVVVQSVLLPKSNFSEQEAINYCLSNKGIKLEEKSIKGEAKSYSSSSKGEGEGIVLSLLLLFLFSKLIPKLGIGRGKGLGEKLFSEGGKPRLFPDVPVRKPSKIPPQNTDIVRPQVIEPIGPNTFDPNYNLNVFPYQIPIKNSNWIQVTGSPGNESVFWNSLNLGRIGSSLPPQENTLTLAKLKNIVDSLRGGGYSINQLIKGGSSAGSTNDIQNVLRGSGTGGFWEGLIERTFGPYNSNSSFYVSFGLLEKLSSVLSDQELSFTLSKLLAEMSEPVALQRIEYLESLPLNENYYNEVKRVIGF